MFKFSATTTFSKAALRNQLHGHFSDKATCAECPGRAVALWPYQ